MISRSALARGTQIVLRRHATGKTTARGFAAAVSENLSYEPTKLAGINVASRDDHGPTTRLAVVAKAGTRYQPLPGLTVGLEEFAFKNTTKRSALRIVRESELLGGQLTAFHTREALVLQASFLHEHLAYFAELLAEVVSETKYTTYEFHEDVERILALKKPKVHASALALDDAHTTAFHTGLGAPMQLASTVPVAEYLNENSVAAFADAAYTKPNVAVVADGASQADLSKWVEQFFHSVPSSSQHSLSTTASKYFGGEQRTAKAGPNAYVMAFPGYAFSSPSPELAVIVALLGGDSNVKWAPGFTLLSKAAASAVGGGHARATNYAYSDAGLLTIEIGGSASAVRKIAEEAAKALKTVAASGVSKEDLTKAIAKAKFDHLAASELGGVGLVTTGASLIHGQQPAQFSSVLSRLESVTSEKVQSAAKALLDGKATVAAVGDLHVLPFAEELGLKV